jgi:hypothetical protein
VLVAAVALIVAPGAAPDSGATQFVVYLHGGTVGQVGDLLMLQVDVTNYSNGPTAGAKLEFTFDADGGLSLENRPDGCVTTTGSGVVREECDLPPEGLQGTRAYLFGVRVTSIKTTLVTAWVQPNGIDGASALSVLGPPDRITNVRPPTLTSNAAVGQSLKIAIGASFSPEYNYRHTYRWLRCTPDLSSCASFDTGAFGMFWILAAADAGCRMAVVDIASSEAGSGIGQSPFSDPVQPVAACNPNGTGGGGGTGGGAAQLSFAQDLPHAEVGKPYSARLITAWTNPLQITFLEGSPPSEFDFDPATYTLSGTPEHGGTRSFTIQALDPIAGIGDRKSYELVVDGPLAPTGGSESARTVLARRAQTPGAYNPDVRPSTSGATICTSRWVAAARPSVSFLRAVKLKQMAAYGESDPSAYVEDHFIPIELGGAARNPKNLWPQSARRAAIDNRLERALQQRVCSGRMRLTAAQRQIANTKRTRG